MLLINSLGETLEFDLSNPRYTGGTSNIYEINESTLQKSIF